LEIMVAKNAGFCFGVSRAVKMAREAAGERREGIYTLGALIHNPQVVGKLEEEGIVAADSVDDIADGSVVVIRSHGVSPHVFVSLEDKKVKIIDATCPFVRKAQKIARDFSNGGYFVIVVGEKNHPEVIGIIGNISGDFSVIRTVEEAKKLELSRKRVAILAQTTQSRSLFNEVIELVKSMGCSEVIWKDTICDATTLRQDDTCRLAKQSDKMIIIGGRNSANTARLAELSKRYCKDTYHIETAEELDKVNFCGDNRVGISAGASTPEWIIQEVIKKIEIKVK